MAYKLEANHPDYPKDTEFDCDGILVPNGGSVTVTEEMERAFYAKNARPIKEIYGHSAIVKLSGSSSLSAKEAAELQAAFAPGEVEESEPEETEEVNA
jgi:hypothetical protein